MAPFFGASTIVWANTIAIVLVALSIGYADGGRFADKAPYPAGLARIVGLRSAHRPPSQYPTDSATSTTPIVFAHTIVEAPK